MTFSSRKPRIMRISQNRRMIRCLYAGIDFIQHPDGWWDMRFIDREVLTLLSYDQVKEIIRNHLPM